MATSRKPDPKPAPAPADDLVTVRLTGRHTHAGVAYQPGEQITCTPEERAWLVRFGLVAEAD